MDSLHGSPTPKASDRSTDNRDHNDNPLGSGRIRDLWAHTHENMLQSSRDDLEIKHLQEDLKIAKEGFKQFRDFYTKLDDKRKEMLVKSNSGQELQAMYLGLKPIILVEKGYQEELFTESLENDFGIIERTINENNKVKKIVFNNSNVEKVLTDNSDYFNYTVGSPISLYMQNLVKQWDIPDVKLTNRDKKLRCIQVGLLCGFPRNAVEQFVKYSNALLPIIEYLKMPVEQFVKLGKDLSAEDQVILKDYLTAGRKGKPDTREVNQYRDKHEQEIRSSLNKTSLKNDKEKIEYLVSLRDKELPGNILYISGNPNDDDRSFEKKVYAIFEQSNMNSYLKSLSRNYSEAALVQE